MKQYEYVPLHINRFFGAQCEEHRTIIDDYAQRGYTFVGYIPTNISDYGKVKDIDLIFEKEIE